MTEDFYGASLAIAWVGDLWDLLWCYQDIIPARVRRKATHAIIKALVWRRCEILNRAQMLIMLSGLVFLTGAASLPAQAERDNNKRQLAISVPIAPITTIKPPTAPTRTTKTAEAVTVGLPDMKVTPEMQKAFQDGARTAGDLSRVVFHKAADVASWMGAIWKKVDTSPTITPCGGPYSGETALGPMRPLEEWGPNHKLFYTNERRMKTVTNR